MTLTFGPLEHLPAYQRFKRIIDAAERHGAKIHRRDFMEWVVLDQQNTPMWTAAYVSKTAAARAYCAHYDLKP